MFSVDFLRFPVIHSGLDSVFIGRGDASFPQLKPKIMTKSQAYSLLTTISCSGPVIAKPLFEAAGIANLIGDFQKCIDKDGYVRGLKWNRLCEKNGWK